MGNSRLESLTLPAARLTFDSHSLHCVFSSPDYALVAAIEGRALQSEGNEPVPSLLQAHPHRHGVVVFPLTMNNAAGRLNNLHLRVKFTAPKVLRTHWEGSKNGI